MKRTSLKIEERIKELEFKIENLLQLVDIRRAPFSYLVVENNLTKEQVDEIYLLMDDFTTYIHAGQKARLADFERELYKIVPSKDRDYHFAADVVGSLHDEEKYAELYDALKRRGMNV
ncbi:MAG: DUF1878 family protein [Nitrososphaerota archaeon]|nr:DUF1878 family protein [Nitrososphaerota archaeon]